MIHRPPLPATTRYRLLHLAKNVAGTVVRGLWDGAAAVGSIGPHSWRAKRWGSIGFGSVICFPYGGHVNERHIHLGSDTLIAPGVTLSAGWGPGHPNLPDTVVKLGDRCLIGRGSSIIGHAYIELGDDVWTGYDVRITDMNHGYEDIAFPISGQWQQASPVVIGDRSWLGHHVVVLPGVTIGRHVTVGAGSVVTEDLPDYSVAVGVPAKVVRRYHPDVGWVGAADHPEGWGVEAERTAAVAAARLEQLR
ncbi:MAG: acyltransferase [Acidimicrobiia bacterium]|nr:acyltransferase [Acidimicrobiia bacterium]